jgi:hypothetical protein
VKRNEKVTQELTDLKVQGVGQTISKSVEDGQLGHELPAEQPFFPGLWVLLRDACVPEGEAAFTRDLLYDTQLHMFRDRVFCCKSAVS